MAQVTPTSTVDRTTEADYAIFGNPTANGSAGNPTASIVKNPDVGAASQAPATDMSGSKTGMEVIKGIFNLLTSLLNATTLATPNTQTLAYTFTIATSTTVTNYTKLTGRVATIFIPSTVLGTTLTVLQRRVDGTGTGFTIKSSDAIARTIVLDGTDQTIDAESCGWLSGAIGSEIAFVSSNAQSSDQTIHVKVLV